MEIEMELEGQSAYRFRWMASIGMRKMGRSIRTSRCVKPSLPRSSTRPATERSRSNHVAQRPPGGRKKERERLRKKFEV